MVVRGLPIAPRQINTKKSLLIRIERWELYSISSEPCAEATYYVSATSTACLLYHLTHIARLLLPVASSWQEEWYPGGTVSATSTSLAHLEIAVGFAFHTCLAVHCWR